MTTEDQTDPTTDPQLDPELDELENELEPTEDDDRVVRYAVYDATLLRFLGGTHETRKAANEAKKSGPSGHKLEVRSV